MALGLRTPLSTSSRLSPVCGSYPQTPMSGVGEVYPTRALRAGGRAHPPRSRTLPNISNFGGGGGFLRAPERRGCLRGELHVRTAVCGVVMVKTSHERHRSSVPAESLYFRDRQVVL